MNQYGKGFFLNNKNSTLNGQAARKGDKKHKSTPEIVANRIVSQIESGELEPGQKLPTQSDLARDFGVGTSSIREAVNVLEIMGYLEVAHGRGMFVREELPLNKSVVSSMEDDLANASAFELFELRELLECHIVKLACQRIDRKGIQHVSKALETMKECVGEKKTFIDADIEFHVAIADAVAFRAAGAIVRIIHELMHKNLDLAITTQTKPYGMEALDSAEQIVEHIVTGEEFFAVRCMKNHLDLPKSAIVKLRTVGNDRPDQS
jgi:GntR family transcriptional repressor for pyruvate dehydrogenase complex